MGSSFFIPLLPAFDAFFTFFSFFFRVLENVKEMWTEYPKSGKKRSRPVRFPISSFAFLCAICSYLLFDDFYIPQMNKDRYVSKMFLRGDNVVLVLKVCFSFFVLKPKESSSSLYLLLF